MLTDTEKHAIDHEIERTEYRRGACIDALQIVQRSRGYVSDESVKDIADYLQMSAAEVDSIATFYNRIYRKPVGKNVVLLCDSISCYLTGYEKVKKSIEDHLKIKPGQTTEDGVFTLIPTQCLGTCDHAPAIMVGDDLHRDLDEKNVVEVLEQYRKKSES